MSHRLTLSRHLIFMIIGSLFADIQSNLVDSKVGRHQATYIPVSKSLLKKGTKSKTPSAIPRPVSISHRIFHDRTTAPDDKNTTTVLNATNLRFKRELQESTTVADDAVKTTEFTSTVSSTATADATAATSEPNDIVDSYETHASSGDATSKPNAATTSHSETSSNHTYPTFHVTYWMFYPYSQVGCTKSIFANVAIHCLGIYDTNFVLL